MEGKPHYIIKTSIYFSNAGSADPLLNTICARFVERLVTLHVLSDVIERGDQRFAQKDSEAG